MTRTLPIIIAHRGACGYLPEHTLAAKAVAHAQGADYLEQDLVLSRDGVPMVLHDIYLDEVTDVAHRFPERARPDGRCYAIDFTLAELLTLWVHERVDSRTGHPAYPARFPPAQPGADGLFRLHTLEEELALIRGLNHSTGRVVGIYPELKAPAWHAAQGLDLTRAVLGVLARQGYCEPGERVFIQCFDPAELKRLRHGLGVTIPLIQLIGEPAWWPVPPADFTHLRTPEGLAEVAEYAAGIGPWIGQYHLEGDGAGQPRTWDLVMEAHGQGLLVHPYTFRRDQLPTGFVTFDDLLCTFIDELGIDGLFTDFPDLVVDYLSPGPRRGVGRPANP